MATSEAARLLDELMGRYRNLLPSDIEKRLTWDSPEVCRYFLVKFCPHDLFTNTKSDLGSCEKIHDEELRKEYEVSTSHRKIAYEDDFIRYADSMLADVDRRIEKGKQRLALSVQEALANSSTGDGRIDEQIQFLSERITGLVSEAERLGSEGNVEEAQGLSKLCDKLREERDALRRANENSVWHQAAEMAASQEKQMEVCEICGAFLIVGDAQQRIDDHLMGKQHVGFARLRQAIKEIRARREEREKQRELEREERRKAMEEDEKRRERDREDRRRRDDDYRRGGYDRRDRQHRDDRDSYNRDRDFYGRNKDHRDYRGGRSDRDFGGHRNRDRSRERNNYHRNDRDYHNSSHSHHRSRDRDRGSREYN
ncbi:Luc7-like protein 3 [Armadillidium nasatum]|uniref:Luc7-like protein 3 n=1 Tax=Armadillidium nasatum TaxID=96803 RepID=A0A5N5SXE6_9CRUS|nr:Luc7-like protein 3 [Armadillidium nasatum]